jgi:hypothetical protein
MQGKDNNNSAFFRGCRESALGPPALWVGARLMAAAGQATTVKLQTDQELLYLVENLQKKDGSLSPSLHPRMNLSQAG